MRPYISHGMIRVDGDGDDDDDDDNDNDNIMKLHTPLDNTLCMATFLMLNLFTGI